jgi:hypothetical protein
MGPQGIYQALVVIHSLQSAHTKLTAGSDDAGLYKLIEVCRSGGLCSAEKMVMANGNLLDLVVV